MPDARTSAEIIQRGQAAEALLKNTLLNEAFEEVLSDVSRRWLATKREAGVDVQQREELHAKANAVAELRGQLRAWLDDALSEINKIERAERRMGAK
jgi:hypothetical protein